MRKLTIIAMLLLVAAAVTALAVYLAIVRPIERVAAPGPAPGAVGDKDRPMSGAARLPG